MLKLLTVVKLLIQLPCSVNELERLGSAAAVERLIQILREERGKRIGNPEKAAKALGIVGHFSAVEPLIEALDVEYGFVSENAALSLGKLGEPAAVIPLIRFLKKHIKRDDTARIKAAVKALGRLKNSQALPVLIATLQMKHHEIPELAAKSLAKIRDKRALQPVIQKCLEHEDSEISERGTILEEIIEQLGGKEARDKVVDWKKTAFRCSECGFRYAYSPAAYKNRGKCLGCGKRARRPVTSPTKFCKTCDRQTTTRYHYYTEDVPNMRDHDGFWVCSECGSYVDQNS